jgi:hypothetical protein
MCPQESAKVPITLAKVPYKKLNSKQKEAHNFQKVSALLADYGYSTIRLQDDWQGADFIAQHCGGVSFVRVQLKSRVVLDKKYLGKDLVIAFPHKADWYLYEHDVLHAALAASGQIVGTKSWKQHGAYSWPGLPKNLMTTGLIHKL